jgi:hypothetical protein
MLLKRMQTTMQGKLGAMYFKKKVLFPKALSSLANALRLYVKTTDTASSILRQEEWLKYLSKSTIWCTGFVILSSRN